jgi:hypothetical protein
MERYIERTRTTEQDRIQSVNEPVVLLTIHDKFVQVGEREQKLNSVTLSGGIVGLLNTHTDALKRMAGNEDDETRLPNRMAVQ